MPDAFISALAPYGLDRVPGYRGADPLGQPDEDAIWRQDWRGWRADLMPWRARIHDAAHDDPDFRAAEMAICAKDPAYWLAMYGWIYEPRPRAGEPYDKPFFPFAFQVDLLQWFIRHVEEVDPQKYDGYVSKSRSIGASWIFCAGALWGWLFRPGWAGHFVSFKEDKVYKRNDRGSLFGKVIYLYELLPTWMWPEGFEAEEHMHRLNFQNPVTGCAITGESTTGKTLRGDRKTWIVYDEASSIESYLNTYGVGAGTADKRFSVSTESYEEGDDWERAWTGALEANPESVKQVEWYDNAYQDAAWYHAEKARWDQIGDPHGFAREYLRDADAAEAGWMYAEAKHLPHTAEGYDASKTLAIGIDPGFADPTALVWGHPIVNEHGRQGIRWLGCYQRAKVPTDFFAHILTGIPPDESDECWPLWSDPARQKFGPREQALMEWFRSREGFVRYVMDPAGKQLHSGKSFLLQLQAKSRELRLREWERNGREGPEPNGITPLTDLIEKVGGMHYEERVQAMRHFLPNSEISDVDPSSHELQTALAKSKFGELTPKAVTAAKPLHDDLYSHLRSAAEYVAVGMLMGLVDPPKHLTKRRLFGAIARKKAA